MAVAFTREEDVEAAAAHLPDRPISPHRNMVTAEGLLPIREVSIDLLGCLRAFGRVGNSGLCIGKRPVALFGKIA